MWKQQIALRNVLGDPWPSMSMVRASPATPQASATNTRGGSGDGGSGEPGRALRPCAATCPRVCAPTPVALAHARGLVQEHGKAFRNDIDDRIALVATVNEVRCCGHALPRARTAFCVPAVRVCCPRAVHVSALNCTLDVSPAQVNRLGRDPQRTNSQQRDVTEQALRSPRGVWRAAQVVRSPAGMPACNICTHAYPYMPYTHTPHFARTCMHLYTRIPNTHARTHTHTHTHTHTGRRRCRRRCCRAH